MKICLILLRVLLGGSLFFFFFLLFLMVKRKEGLKRLLKKTVKSFENADRQRLLVKRIRLHSNEKEKGFVARLERKLSYSGLKNKFHFITVEGVFLINVLILLAGSFLTIFSLEAFLFFALFVIASEWLVLEILCVKNNKKVNNDLLNFLEFCGNFSKTKGEITSIFADISRYVQEPLKTALLNAEIEARTTGDTSLALLSLADSIEHPEFKNIIRSFEVANRYCADFDVLVGSLRGSVRDYLESKTQNRAVLREAAINLLLLLIMSVLGLSIVNGMLDENIWLIVFGTGFGRLTILIVLLVMVVFVMKIKKYGE